MAALSITACASVANLDDFRNVGSGGGGAPGGAGPDGGGGQSEGGGPSGGGDQGGSTGMGGQPAITTYRDEIVGEPTISSDRKSTRLNSSHT